MENVPVKIPIPVKICIAPHAIQILTGMGELVIVVPHGRGVHLGRVDVRRLEGAGDEGASDEQDGDDYGTGWG